MPTGTLRDNDIVGAIADAIAKNVESYNPRLSERTKKE